MNDTFTDEMDIPVEFGVKAKLWTDLVAEKRELEDKLKVVNKKLGDLEGPLMEDMSVAGLDSFKGHGFNIYKQTRHTFKRGEGVSGKQLAAAFAAEGLDDAVNVNAQTMNAILNELLDREEGIPEPLAALVVRHDIVQLRSQKVS